MSGPDICAPEGVPWDILSNRLVLNGAVGREYGPIFAQLLGDA